MSQTEWITSYIIRPGGRLSYQLNIIDTPGFGDTRGLQRDNEIVEQIRQLFSENSMKGVSCIDAICFLAKAPDARLTAIQRYIFQAIMSLFGKDIEKNICSLITFADGISPPVVAALKESKLPFGEIFTFNNSGLFAKNDSSNPLAPMFWDMGVKSFQNFFQHLDTVHTQSLTLTKNVLDERKHLEVTIFNLQKQVGAGLNKVSELKQEIKIFQENKSEIERNKDFVYEVSETQQQKVELPSGKHVTNCLTCSYTCHLRCGIPNDDGKKGCSAMNPNGYCRVCPKKCFWQIHANSKYEFRYEVVKVKKTYSDKLQKYKDAQGKLPNQKQVIKILQKELNNLSEAVNKMLRIIRDCNERLKETALRPNPLSMTEHIDLMIEAEKMEKKGGYMDRIKVLQEFRKRAEFEKDAERFREEAQAALFDADVEGKSVWDTIKNIFNI